MIRFKEKIYFLPAAANVAMIGSSVMGLKQGADSQKQQEEANEEQTRLMKKQNEALVNLAKQNPQQAVQVQGIKQNQFSIMSSNAGKFIKDMGNMMKTDQAGGVLGKATGFGLVSGVGTYIGNKVIQGAEAARNKPDSQQRGYSWGGSFINGVKKQMTPGMLAFGAGVPLLFYGIDRINQKNTAGNMVNNTQSSPTPANQPQSIMSSSQRNYAFNGTAVKGFFNRIRPDSFTMGFGGKLQGAGKWMQQNGTSDWTKKLGSAIEKHPQRTAWATLAPGLVIGGKVMETGEKVVEKPMRMIDSGAYKYQDQQESQVE